MKLTFFSLLALAAGASWLATPALAQTFPNADFETWATRTTSVIGGVEAPVNWLTDDDEASFSNGMQSFLGIPEPLPASLQSVVRTSIAHGGAAAAQLLTKRYLGRAGDIQTYATLYLGDRFGCGPH